MAKGTMIIIGCRLPHGLVINHPLAKGVTATIAGMKSSRIIGADHITTEIDADLWAAWKLTHEDFPAIKSGAIFEARTESEASSKAKEFRKEKTGLEAMKPETMGVKPAESE